MPDAMYVRRVPLTDLHEDPANARVHSDDQIEKLAAIFVRFGQQIPVVIDASNVVRAGNARLRAARKLGWTHLDCVRTELSGSELVAFSLADNRIAELAGWDWDVLPASVSALRAEGFDVASLGWNDAEVEAMMRRMCGNVGPVPVNAGGDAPGGKAGDDGSDGLPPDPARSHTTSVTLPGDVWLLRGKSGIVHRLGCGDSGDPAHVVRVAGLAPDGSPRKVALCFTSPPYLHQRDYGETGRVGDWDALMDRVLGGPALAAVASPACQVLVNLGLVHKDGEFVPYWDPWLVVMRAAGWLRHGWYVWDQGDGLPGDPSHGRLASAHEFVFHFQRDGGVRSANKIVPNKHAGTGDHLRSDGRSTAQRTPDGIVREWTHVGRPVQMSRVPDSVIRVTRHKGPVDRAADAGHPAPFPVALAREMILTWTDRGDAVWEPFCGSGTQILAAEETGRLCAASEIDPAYCDGALARWCHAVGTVPTRESDGMAFPVADFTRKTTPIEAQP